MKSGIKTCAKSYASKTGCSLAEADKAMKTAIEVIRDEIIENGGVSFIDNFSIEVVKREARNYIHPVDGMTHVIPARKTLKLVVGKKLREAINK